MYFFQIPLFVFWKYISLRILLVKTGFVFRKNHIFNKVFFFRSLMLGMDLLTLGLWIIFWPIRSSGKSGVRWKLLDGVRRLWTRSVQTEVDKTLNFNALRNSLYSKSYKSQRNKKLTKRLLLFSLAWSSFICFIKITDAYCKANDIIPKSSKEIKLPEILPPRNRHC